MKVALREIIRTETQEQSLVAAELTRMFLYTVAGVSVLIGIWGFAGFVGGMVAEGGPFSLVGSWFRAVFGL